MAAEERRNGARLGMAGTPRSRPAAALAWKPQWSPPWNGGNTDDVTADAELGVNAAMEPALEWREHLLM